MENERRKGESRMSVTFRLDIDKVIATAIYIASRNIPELTPGKLFKLMFLAEKYHLVHYGRPITGDRYDAMNDGPVPSFTYDLFKRQILRRPFTEPGRRLAAALDVIRSGKLPQFKALHSFDPDQLSKSDILALDKTIQKFGLKTFEELSDITHAMVAYDKAWKSKGMFRKSSPMKFEDFFEDETDAIEARDEMVENYHLHRSFAKP